jgi:hypothetical protein
VRGRRAVARNLLEELAAEVDYVRSAVAAAVRFGVGGVEGTVGPLLQAMGAVGDALTDKIVASGGRQ